jgi:hypothetical protein
VVVGVAVVGVSIDVVAVGDTVVAVSFIVVAVGVDLSHQRWLSDAPHTSRPSETVVHVVLL